MKQLKEYTVIFILRLTKENSGFDEMFGFEFNRLSCSETYIILRPWKQWDQVFKSVVNLIYNGKFKALE